MTQADINAWIAIVTAATAALIPVGRGIYRGLTGHNKASRDQAGLIFDQAVKMMNVGDARIERLEKSLSECEEDRANIWRVLRENGLVPVVLRKAGETTAKDDHHG